MTDASLALAVDEQLCLRGVCIAIDWSHLAFTSRPCPVGQYVDCVVVSSPVAAVEIVAVFGKSGEVANAEIAAAAWPVGVVGSRLAQIVVACPNELADDPWVVLLTTPVIVGKVAP